MAKGRAKPGKQRAPVMFPPEAKGRLKSVATRRGLTVEQAVEKYLVPVIDAEYRKVVAAEYRELGGEG